MVEIITATIASSDASICESETYTLEVTIVGNNPPFELDYSIGGDDYTETNITDLDLTIDLSAQFSLGSNTITLNEIRDSDTPINTGSIIGGSVTVTVYDDHPAPYTVTSGGDICGATTTTVELDGSEVGFTYDLFRDGIYSVVLMVLAGRYHSLLIKREHTQLKHTIQAIIVVPLIWMVLLK